MGSRGGGMVGYGNRCKATKPNSEPQARVRKKERVGVGIEVSIKVCSSEWSWGSGGARPSGLGPPQNGR